MQLAAQHSAAQAHLTEELDAADDKDRYFLRTQLSTIAEDMDEEVEQVKDRSKTRLVDFFRAR